MIRCAITSLQSELFESGAVSGFKLGVLHFLMSDREVILTVQNENPGLNGASPNNSK